MYDRDRVRVRVLSNPPPSIQVALEGGISKRSAVNSLAKGDLPQGDLLPWTVSSQFQDPDFPGLSGGRVVRPGFCFE